MTAIRNYFNNLSDEELCIFFTDRNWDCEEECPLYKYCKNENLNTRCSDLVKKYGLKEVKE